MAADLRTLALGESSSRRLEAACTVCGADEPFDALFLRDHLGPDVFRVPACRRCGARYVADPPVPERIGEYYKTSAGDAMHSKPGRLFSIMRDRRIGTDLAPLFDRLASGARIVDLGTGDGSLARYVSRREFRPMALDVYPEADWPDSAIPYRQVDLAAAGLQLKDLSDVSGDGAVDAVVMRHVLEHVHRPCDVLKTLREGGVQYVLVIVPNVESRLARRLGSAWYYWDPPRHLTFFSPRTLERLASRAGFHVAEQRTYGIDELVTSAHRALLLHGTTRARRVAGMLRPTGLVAGASTVLATKATDAVCHALLEVA